VLVGAAVFKQLYVSSLSSYYHFYLIEKFRSSRPRPRRSIFSSSSPPMRPAPFFGGSLGDRFGRKYVIWFSILGALPFTLALPYAGLFGSAVLTVFIGLILSSATSSIIVFAQELMPHRFGMISGVFFGVAFGIGGLGAPVLGKVADHTGMRLRLSALRVPARRSGCSRCSCRRCRSRALTKRLQWRSGDQRSASVPFSSIHR
jgi:FSR family fosmidomycin resistance protein-like MFS transporter